MRFGVILGVAGLRRGRSRASAFAQPASTSSRRSAAISSLSDTRATSGPFRERAGNATRVTTGTGVESGPMLSPDGSTIAFTGEYDGNQDVFTVPATGACQSASPSIRALMWLSAGRAMGATCCSAPPGTAAKPLYPDLPRLDQWRPRQLRAAACRWRIRA